MSKLKELAELRAKSLADARAINDKADAEGRVLTAEEQAAYDKAFAASQKYGDDIKRRQALEAEESRLSDSLGRRTQPDANTPPANTDKPYVVEGPRGMKTEIAPNSPLYGTTSATYRSAFASYLGSGVPSAGLQTSTDTKGGYLAPVTLSNQLIKFLDDMVWIRRLSNVLPPLGQSVSLGVPSWDTDPGDADWTAEVPGSDISEDDTAAVGKREFVPSLLTKLVKISMKMLRTGVVDVESLVAQRLAYKFAVTEEKAFLTGTGAQQPLGIFTASTSGVSTSRDVTASATTSFNGDDLKNMVYNLKMAYRNNAAWVMHRDAVKMAAKLKDSSGQYLWNLGPVGTQLNGAEPGTLIGIPVYESEFAPSTFTTGQYVAILGDFRAGYWIADSLSLEVQRLGELFSLKNQVGLLGRKETDGAPVLGEAFSRLKLA